MTLYLVVALAAFVTSLFTLFSGFGLGTLLMPVFAIFFPLDLAISLTAVVHLLNNLFKLILLGKFADKKIVLKFGLPAILAAFAGAWLLVWFSGIPPIHDYFWMGRHAEMTWLKIIMALLMIFFAVFEMLPAFKNLQFDKKYLMAGGLLSGFFGGLSGHQGALRSAFLIRCGLSKESYIATGVVIACLIDFSRLFIYSTRFSSAVHSDHFPILVTATLSAFLGVWLGNRWMKKVTLEAIQILVSFLLLLIALALGFGII